VSKVNKQNSGQPSAKESTAPLPRQAAPERTSVPPKAPSRTPAKAKATQAVVSPTNDNLLNKLLPLLPLVVLAVLVLVVYYPTFHFGFTELDDSIFIRDMREYTKDLGNFWESFSRGVFDPVKDSYYRPLFLNSMILNYQLSGEDIGGYHVINVLIHIVNVWLVYWLFQELQIKKLHAFIFAMIFAVHPVISQAVAWIPGRNDTILTLFTLPFILLSLRYTRTGANIWLVLSGVCLMLAFFTKETAVFDAPVALALILFVQRKSWRSRENLIQYGLWALCFGFWLFMRSRASLENSYLEPTKIATDFVHRLPLIVQYLGKIFIPVNLSVFPIQQDTVYYYGYAAVALLVALILLAKAKDMRLLWAGLAVFLLFLLPALLVPNTLNQQTFEHRLYLPLIGILIMLTQTVLFRNKLGDKPLLAGFGVIVIALMAGNFMHQKYFKDPVTFWSQAVATSPHSAYANMMLGARVKDPQTSYRLFHLAYRLNPDEKYLNYYYGVMLQQKDSVLASESYFWKEKGISNYYECDKFLARVKIERQQFDSAIFYFNSYLKNDPNDELSNKNLLLTYLTKGELDNAKHQAQVMQRMGLKVPAQILAQLHM
jgi:protein O-mannosyl-transferase